MGQGGATGACPGSLGRGGEWGWPPGWVSSALEERRPKQEGTGKLLVRPGAWVWNPALGPRKDPRARPTERPARGQAEGQLQSSREASPLGPIAAQGPERAGAGCPVHTCARGVLAVPAGRGPQTASAERDSPDRGGAAWAASAASGFPDPTLSPKNLRPLSLWDQLTFTIKMEISFP